MGLRGRQSWGQMLISRLSTASQWPSGQVLVLGEQVEKFLVMPVMEHTAGCYLTWANSTMVGLTLSWSPGQPCLSRDREMMEHAE